MSKVFKLVLFLMVLLSPGVSRSQTVSDLWVSMPEALVPYLTLNQKKEMIECQAIGVDSDVKNKFEGMTSIDTLTADYGKFRVSESRNIQLLRFQHNGDSVVMFIDTYLVPEPYSKVAFYDLKWNSLPLENEMRKYTARDFLEKPDTLSDVEFREMEKLVAMNLVAYDYDVETKTLTVSPAFPLTTLDEKQRLEGLVCKKVLKTTGEIFN